MKLGRNRQFPRFAIHLQHDANDVTRVNARRLPESCIQVKAIAAASLGHQRRPRDSAADHCDNRHIGGTALLAADFLGNVDGTVDPNFIDGREEPVRLACLGSHTERYRVRRGRTK